MMQDSAEYKDKGLYKRLLIRGILAVIGVVCLFFLLPRVIHILFPFVLAFIVAVVLNPLVNWINRKLGVSRRIIALVLDLLAFLIVASLVVLLAYSVVNEAVALATSIQSNWSEILARLDGLG